MLAALAVYRRYRGCLRQRLALALRLHFLRADSRLQFQQLHLCIAELLALGSVFLDQFQPQAFFQRTDLPLGPLQFLGQQLDLFGFGTGRIGRRWAHDRLFPG